VIKKAEGGEDAPPLQGGKQRGHDTKNPFFESGPKNRGLGNHKLNLKKYSPKGGCSLKRKRKRGLKRSKSGSKIRGNRKEKLTRVWEGDDKTRSRPFTNGTEKQTLTGRVPWGENQHGPRKREQKSNCTVNESGRGRKGNRRSSLWFRNHGRKKSVGEGEKGKTGAVDNGILLWALQQENSPITVSHRIARKKGKRTAGSRALRWCVWGGWDATRGRRNADATAGKNPK